MAPNSISSRSLGPTLAILSVTLSILALRVGEYFLARIFVETGRESSLLWVNRHYYREVDRAMLQYENGCMVADPVLGYRLNSGGCTFRNREFTTTITANSQGLRDDEQSLHAPETIVLGDSHAMGWGVENRETFSQVLEEQSGALVLNAAIASYGTARELLLLKELDISRLRTLIIQYNSSDQGENEVFLRDPPGFTRDTIQRFTFSQREYSEFRSAAPRSFLVGYLPLLFQHLYNPSSFTRTPFWKNSDREAFLFLKVLDVLLPKNRSFQILVLDITGHTQNTKDFVHEVESQNQGIRAHISTLDLEPVLTTQDYFVLDDHINTNGHAKIANAILAHLDE